MYVPLESQHFFCPHFYVWKQTNNQGGKTYRIPLQLAWAVSIHKSQGMTLDRIDVNLAEAFEHGQAYVALSRVTGLEGLLLRDFNKSKIKAHPKVLEYYKKIDPLFDEPSNEGDKDLRAFMRAKYQAKKEEALTHTADYSRILQSIKERNSSEGLGDSSARPGCSKDGDVTSSSDANVEIQTSTEQTNVGTKCDLTNGGDRLGSKFLNSTSKGNLSPPCNPVDADARTATPFKTPPKPKITRRPTTSDHSITKTTSSSTKSSITDISTSPLHGASAGPSTEPVRGSKTLRKAESFLERCKQALEDAKSSLEEKPKNVIVLVDDTPEGMDQELVDGGQDLKGMDGSIFDGDDFDESLFDDSMETCFKERVVKSPHNATATSSLANNMNDNNHNNNSHHHHHNDNNSNSHNNSNNNSNNNNSSSNTHSTSNNNKNFLDSICPDLLSMSQQKKPFLYPTPKRKRSGEWSESPSSKRPAESLSSSATTSSIQSPSSTGGAATNDRMKDLLKKKADEIEQKRKAALEKRRQSLQQQQQIQQQQPHKQPQPLQPTQQPQQPKHHHSATITEVKGDLFSAPPTSSLAHCISKDCKLGAGIAKIFRQRFGRVDELQQMGTVVGGVSPLQVNDRFIYNLVTKENYWGKPTYKSLLESLRAMQNHAFQHDVREICMPRIGCGIDKLEWDRVKLLLEEVFGKGRTHITVYCV